MKPILFLALCTTLSSYSQKVYDLDKKELKTLEQVITKSVKTEDKAIYKGQQYDVYKTEKCKLFIVAMSNKTNNYYRKYLKENGK